MSSMTNCKHEVTKLYVGLTGLDQFKYCASCGLKESEFVKRPELKLSDLNTYMGDALFGVPKSTLPSSNLNDQIGGHSITCYFYDDTIVLEDHVLSKIITFHAIFGLYPLFVKMSSSDFHTINFNLLRYSGLRLVLDLSVNPRSFILSI